MLIPRKTKKGMDEDYQKGNEKKLTFPIRKNIV